MLGLWSRVIGMFAPASRIHNPNSKGSQIMRRLICGALGLGALFVFLATTSAQPPGRPGPGGSPGRDDGPPPPPGPVFEALDKDHDGALSAEEIQAASESLKKLDKNGDGKLTEDELHPQGGPGRPPGRPGEAGPGGRDRHDP